MKRRHILDALCIALACMSLGSPSRAQDNVVVTVSATAADICPFLTSRKPDFTVHESGKPRSIASFVGPETKPAALPQLQPNEFSNLPDFD
jgi:hypothetical protein